MASPVPKKPLSKDGPLVPTIGFGAMGISSFYGTIPSDQERLKILDRAWEIGAHHWDTADMYGDSEDLLGKWFAKNPEKRKDIFLATKFGAVFGSDGSITIRSDPEHVHQACEKSLKRLGVEFIDLYYCHRVDLKTPVEKTIEAMVELKRQGKIKYLGISEISAMTLRRASAVHQIHALQMEYSPFEMTIEDPSNAVLKTARELGVALVAYSPLGRGLMTGVYRKPEDFEEGDFRKIAPRFMGDNFSKNLDILRKFEDIAQGKGITAGQLCLAWLLAQGDDIFLIPGTKKIKYLEENTNAAVVKLSDAENKELRSLIEAADVQGARVPEAYATHLFGDTPQL